MLKEASRKESEQEAQTIELKSLSSHRNLRTDSPMKLWKINCMEDQFRGMWQRWYRNQCVAVGWHSEWGFPLEGQITAEENGPAWSRARSSLKKIEIGDYVIVSLKGHRVGRLGEVTGKAIEDHDWNPLVPLTKDYPQGEMGRRIFVRWDLTTGPEGRDEIVLLPEESRFTSGELRPTIAEIRSQSLDSLKTVINDQSNWESLFAHFDYEKALSGYIATYPHHLEDGLTVHPTLKVRELTFQDRTRSDVILIDRDDQAVIVECKQGQPVVADINQLRRYLARLTKEKGVAARGILVHGGSKKLHDDVAKAAEVKPKIQIVQHRLAVDFSRCN